MHQQVARPAADVALAISVARWANSDNSAQISCMGVSASFLHKERFIRYQYLRLFVCGWALPLPFPLLYKCYSTGEWVITFHKFVCEHSCQFTTVLLHIAWWILSLWKTSLYLKNYYVFNHPEQLQLVKLLKTNVFKKKNNLVW